MEDLINIVNDINQIIKTKNDNIDIYKPIIEKIFYELEDFKYILINHNKKENQISDNIKEFNNEIEKRDRIIKKILPILIHYYFNDSDEQGNNMI